MSVISCRAVTELEDIERIVELQTMTWGKDAVTPLPQIVAVLHHGGMVIGAYQEEQLVGFCYGFPGFDGQSVHLCSHMMAIRPDFRDQGIGYQLKMEQRKWCLEYGYKKVMWTFDPLESRNGFLNLCKLGAYVRTYIKSYYGEMNDTLNRGLPSDRFLVEWDLQSARVEIAATGKSMLPEEWKTYPELMETRNMNGLPEPVERLVASSTANGFLFPVPANIHRIKKENMDLAKIWRFQLRERMMLLLSKGYFVTGVLRGSTDDNVNYYVLERNLDSATE